MRTQDIDVRRPKELYALDPDYVTIPDGKLHMTPIVFWSLVALRVYLVALIGLVGYRFIEYARLFPHQ